MCFMHETALKQTHYVGYKINVFEDIITKTSCPLSLGHLYVYQDIFANGSWLQNLTNAFIQLYLFTIIFRLPTSNH